MPVARGVATRAAAHDAAVFLAGLTLLLFGCSGPVEVPQADLSGAEVAVRYEIEKWHSRVTESPGDGSLWGRYGTALDAHGYDPEAESVYVEAIRLDPEDVRWPYYLAALLANSRPKEAVSWYRRSLELRPDYAPAHIRLAQNLQALEQPDAAAQHFLRATQLEPANAFGHLGLGQLRLHDGNLEAAVAHLERAASGEPLMNATLAALAQAHQRSGNTELASSLAEQARDLPRKTYQADPLLSQISDAAVDRAGLMSRAVTYREVGQLERALELAHKAAASGTHSGSALLVADLYERLERYGEAEQWAQRATEGETEPQGLHELRARVFFQQGKFFQAARAAGRAVEIDELSADGHMVLGRTALAQGNPNKAAEHLRLALRARPQDFEWRAALVNALVAAGKHQEAAIETSVLKQSDRHHPEAWLALGENHLQASRFKPAADAFEQVLVLEESDAALAGLVQSLLQSKGPAAAQRRLEHQIATHPNHVVAVLLLTDFLAAAGRIDEALKSLEDLSRQSPNNAEIWLQRGNLQLSTGSLEEARTAFNKALALSQEPQLRALATEGLNATR